MIEQKRALRAEYKQIRASLGESSRREQSLRIAERLFETEEYKRARLIFVYISFGTEVETDEIVKKIFLDGKWAAVPLCDTESGTMQAVLINDVSCLKKGAYGIPEPDGGEIINDKDKIDLVIVPALSFDRSRARLGYGGGYYDRFLKDYSGSVIGLCFDSCLAGKLPTEEFDCRADKVICSEEMF